MSDLTDFIAAYPADALFDALQADSTFAVLNLLWRTPGEMAEVCSIMGWTTVEDVAQWVEAVNSAMIAPVTFASLAQQRVPFVATTRIAWPDIHKALAEQMKVAPDCAIVQSDRNYQTVSAEEIELIAQASPAKRSTYRSEVNDCDDFTKSFLGWLASNGYGNLAMGWIGTLHYSGDRLTGAHAMVAAVDDSHTVHIIEPQNGRVYTPQTAVKLGGNILANRMVVNRIIF